MGKSLNTKADLKIVQLTQLVLIKKNFISLITYQN